MKKLFIFIVCLVLVKVCLAQAQTVRITGTVTGREDGLPVPGVSVTVKGTTVGILTNIDGKYELNVPVNSQTLVYSFVGMKPQEVAINSRTIIDIILETDSFQIDEVVVTALGISRTKKSLGYATQEVKGDAVTTVKTSNFMNTLSGKLSGVQIKKNTNMGGSTNVIIRGSKSLTNNNQVLYIVDGVPVNNNIGTVSNNAGGGSSQSTGGVGYDYGNAASDINPEDIESINILKGSAATALYGSRGNSGVILITTKKGAEGKKGIGVTINSNVSISSIDKSTFPKYQDKYGAGYGPYYGANGDFFNLNPQGGSTGTLYDWVPTTEDASYGAKFDGHNVYGWYSVDPQSPWYQQARPWVAAKNGPITFFTTPVSFTNSVSIDNSADRFNYRLSYTNSNTPSGLLPNSKMNKDNFLVNAVYKVTSKLTATVSANYIKQTATGRNSTGYNDNIMSGFRQWWEVNTDIKDMKTVYDLTHRNITWNYDESLTKPIYWDNPYFTRYQNYENDGRTRTIGNISLDYKLASWLDVFGRVSADSYSEIQEERRAVGSVPTTFGISRTNQGSGYLRRDNTFSEYNFDLMLNFKKDLTEFLNLTGVFGFNERRTNNTYLTTSTNGGLSVPGIYTLQNSIGPLPFPVEYNPKIGVRSVYLSASLGYKNFLFLDGTFRRDYASSLPVDKNKYNYPSLTGSFIFTDLVKQSWLSLGKLRLNWAQVGNLAPFDALMDQYTAGTPMNGSIYVLPPVKNNPELKSETTISYEAGLEMNFMKNRFGFDLSLYQQDSKDQIMPVTLSQTTGYSFMYVNAGQIRNRGAELTLNVAPVQTPSIRWDINLNIASNRNKVISLYGDIKNYQLGAFQSGITANAAVDEPYGALKGTDYTYTADGQMILNAETGLPVKTATKDHIIGNINPDWTGGINNTITYKNLSLSFLIDVQKGGDIHSLDMYYGLSSGLYPETAGNNELGNPVRDPVSEGGGYLIKGVNVDASGNVIGPNTTRVDATNYSGWGYMAQPDKAFIYDAGFVKLREVVLSYTLPKLWFERSFIQNVSVSVVGSNLWIIHKSLPYADPESGLSAGNIQGYSIGSLPSTRDFGFNIKINF